MDRSDATHVAVGGTLLAAGGGGMIALLIYAAGAKPPAWDQAWFLTVFSITALLAVLGTYVLAAIYAPLPLPATRSEREHTPRLTVDRPQIVSVTQHGLILRIGIRNGGRRDVRNAIINLLVPNFVNDIILCTETGTMILGGGGVSANAQSLLDDDTGNPVESIYWHGRNEFPGRVYRPMYWSIQIQPLREFPLRLTITAAELKAEFEKEWKVQPPEAEPRDRVVPRGE